MGEFAIQRRLFKRFVAERPAISAGMRAAIAEVRRGPHGGLWADCKPPDWGLVESRWIGWLNTLLTKHPLPRSGVRLLWFEVPSELNGSLTSVSAYSRLDPSQDEFGMEDGRVWPEGRRGGTPSAGLFKLPELDRMYAQVGWSRTESTLDNDRLRPGVFALSHALITLLALNGLPRSRLRSERGVAECVGVVVGWAEGGCDVVGKLDADGWKPLRRSARPPNPDEIDPRSSSFRLGKFLAAGGDPNWTDRRSGQTLLMKCWLSPPSDVLRLVEAGADPLARDNSGRTVLHYFGACDLPVLQCFLRAGANLQARDRGGVAALDRVIDDGRCTVRHLEVLQEHSRVLRPRLDPVLGIAASGVHHATRERELRAMLEFWMARKFSVRSQDSRGRDALWIALCAHAEEFSEHLQNLKKAGYFASGHWNYQHDLVAVLLLKCGADPCRPLGRARCKLIPRGASPLMVQRYDSERLVKALLEHGADPLARSAEGKTALDYAMMVATDSRRPDAKGAKKVAAILRRAMNKSKPPLEKRSSESSARSM